MPGRMSDRTRARMARPCACCGRAFSPLPHKVRAGEGRYCSRACYAADWRSRFWARVDTDGPVPAHRPDLGPCWLWTGAPGGTGYGRLRVDGRYALAHRASYALHRGRIPAGLWVLHRCDTPACVNPAHLFLGTTQENTADMVAKGRQARGERHASRRHHERVARGERVGTARLTAAQVAAIRERYAAGGVSTRTLAAEYGISPTLLKLIVRGEVWRCGPR